MESAIWWLAQNILDDLSTPQLQAWIRREGLAGDIQMLESEVEMVDMLCAAARERAAGNKALGRPFAALKDLLYDADDLVDELDYYRLLDLQISPTTGSPVVGRKDKSIQSAQANLFVNSPTSDSSDTALREQEDIFGAVQIREKSRGAMDIQSSQVGKRRCLVWEHFVVSDTDENNRPVKAKCVHCGSELNCGPKHGTSGLMRHFRSAGCTKKREAASQLLNPSSRADGTENGETVAIGDSRSTKRMRMDGESTHRTKDNSLRDQEDLFGAVQVHETSRGDMDTWGRQGVKTRSMAWKHFVVLEADENNRPEKAKCVRCGSELNCGPKHGTSGLERHIGTEACTKKKEAADHDQQLNPSRLFSSKVDKKSKGDIHTRGRQGVKTRSMVWEHFVVLEADENNRPVKAKCAHCGSEVNCGLKHGTSGLKRHICSAGCTEKKEPADHDQQLNPSRLFSLEVDKKSKGDIHTRGRQGVTTRSMVWEHFVVSEADEDNRPMKAKCAHCGSEQNCEPKHGTSGLKRHIISEGCTTENEAADHDQQLNHSSSADGIENGEAVAIGDSRNTKRRMDDESTHRTKVLKHLWNKSESLHRIQEITRMLNDTSLVLKLHGELLVACPSHCRSKTSDQHLRTSSVASSKFYGRVTEKNCIIKSLTEDKTDGLCVLPIVGSAGVGKTTLVQFVYNDSTVAEHFDQRIWVSVSNNFDEVRLSRERLDFVSQQTHNGLCSFSKVQEVLKLHILSKRILLIFDDVWDDFNICRWDQLLAPLRNTKGTVILLTTRKWSVAKTVGTVEPIKLGNLADKDFWLLFESCAFGDEDSERNQNLSIIGMQIAKQLSGNPLAAATVGGLLRRNLTIDRWNNTLKNEDWISLELDGGIMSALKISYDQLPYHLQQCFSLCSIFPKKYQFLGEELVQIWISQGFVKCDHSSKRLEEKGMDYLADLVNRGFFEQVETEGTHPGGQTCYVICGLMHDFARVVSRTECLTIDGLQCCEMLPSIRHLSIVSGSGYSKEQDGNIPCNKNFEKELLTVCTSLRKLRSLVLIGQYDLFFKSFQRVLQEAHNLRLLQISGACTGLNTVLCSLANSIHLRYLKVDSADGLEALPQILSKFHHLQVLHLGSYTNPMILVGIDHIVSLRHLVAVEGTYPSIANIGNLTSLQELPNFVVRNSSGFKITQLQSMEELVQLGVFQLENVKTREEAYGAGLRDKQHLEKLHLSWTSDDKYGSDMSFDKDWLAVEVLEGFEPHNNLKHLQISGYSGQLFPTWLAGSISVTSLQTLHIEDCGKLEILPSLEQLPFLRKLKLMAMRSVTEVSFPSLEELVLIQMPKLEWCSCISTLDLSSSLRVLEIKGCPELKVFPLFGISQKFKIKQKVWLPSLRKLTIDGCPNLHVPHLLPSSMGIYG